MCLCYVSFEGDTPPHVLWEESQQGQIAYSRWLAEAVQRFIPGARAYTCVGNHGTSHMTLTSSCTRVCWLCAGDTPCSVLWEETQPGQIGYSRWFAEAVQRFLPGARGYMCVGNHGECICCT